jgi:signal transduction histidine kinase
LIINFLISISSVLLFAHIIYTIKIQRGSLNRLNVQLKSSNEEKDRMLGIAAHDLRSPIAKIFQITELLTDDSFKLPPDKKKSFEEMIKSTCKDMLILLNKTLDFSKIESGKLDLKKRKIDYIKFVEKAIENNVLFAEKKGIHIILKNFGSNSFIELDTDHFNQVMDNLLSNSIKYSYPNTKITIRISKKENTLITEIVDEGVGIKADELERIFLPFQRSTSKPTGGESSTGLGLFIVKRIIEEHQGTISVSSLEDRGTTVTFKLPI